MYTELECAYKAQGGTSAMFLHNFLGLPPSMSSPLPQSKGSILQDPLPIEPTSLHQLVGLNACAFVFFLGVRIAVESDFEHDFLHDVDALAAVKKTHCRRRPCRRGGGALQRKRHDDVFV